MTKESKARKKYGLAVTCPASRHAEMIANELIKNKLSHDIQDDPSWVGESIKAAVHSLWKERSLRMMADDSQCELKKLKSLVRSFLMAVGSVPFRAVDCDRNKVHDLRVQLEHATKPKRKAR